MGKMVGKPKKKVFCRMSITMFVYVEKSTKKINVQLFRSIIKSVDVIRRKTNLARSQKSLRS